MTQDHPNDHLSLDDLAELDEDLLEPDRAASARAHLAGCETCRAQLAQLSEVRAQLRDLPRPEMPAEVATRVETALAQAGDATDPTVVPLAGAAERRRFGRPTAAATAAAAAVVLLVGAIVVALVHHSGDKSGTEATGVNGTATATSGLAPANQQPKDYRLSASGDVYTPTTLTRLVPGLVTSATQAPSAGRYAPTGTSQTPAAEPSHAPTSASTNTSSPTQAGPAQAGPGAATDKHRSAALLAGGLRPDYGNRSWLLSCARYLTGESNAVPIAIDFGRWTNASYKSAPSIVFVFRDINPSYVDVFVSGPTCHGTDAIRTYQTVGVTP